LAGGAATADVPAATGAGRGRLLVLAGCAALAVVAIGIVWVVVTGLIARSRLDAVRSELGRLRRAVVAGDLRTAQRLGRQIEQQAASAHELTSGPAWWVAANLPVLGTPLQSARTITTAAHRVSATALPAVLRMAGDLDRARHGAGLDLGVLAGALPSLHRASANTTAATEQVAAAAPSWLGPVSSARSALLTNLRLLDGELLGAQRAVHLAVPMLGQDRPQRYFIGFLNEAEARGLGGIPGAFAIAVADHGSVRFERFGTDTDLKHLSARVDLGADFTARYGNADPTGVFANTDLSPDFRYAAPVWADLWYRKTGERVDGAIALDPTALHYLLNATGPARLADGTQVSAGNVVALTQRDQYSRFPGTGPAANAERKAYLVAVARAVSARLASGGSPQRLAAAVVRAVAERRFMVWSADGEDEAALLRGGWAGALPSRAGAPVTGFAVNNAAGDKLDYYLHASMTYHRTSCASGAIATATVRLTNAAPASGLPSYVTARRDQPPPGAQPGDNHVLVTYYATPGAKITAVRLDGQPLIIATPPERGLVTATVDLELPRSRTRTIAISLREPQATEPVQVLRPPLVHAITTTVRAPGCR
jgi:hypothetical protein